MDAKKTQLRTATSNREDRGAHGARPEVKFALAFNVALAAGLAALAARWGYALPAIGSVFACIVSAVTLALTSRGGAE